MWEPKRLEVNGPKRPKACAENSRVEEKQLQLEEKRVMDEARAEEELHVVVRVVARSPVKPKGPSKTMRIFCVEAAQGEDGRRERKTQAEFDLLHDVLAEGEVPAEAELHVELLHDGPRRTRCRPCSGCSRCSGPSSAR